MRWILFISLCALFISNVYTEFNNQENSEHTIRKVAESFYKASYNYMLLSKIVDHSDDNLPGITKLARELAEDKNKLADMCMNYIITREQAKTFPKFHFHLQMKPEDKKMFKYEMTARQAMEFIYKREDALAQITKESLETLDLHGQHFMQHTVMEAQYDRVARIENLFSIIKKDDSYRYAFQFDQNVNFSYHNLYTTPAKISVYL